MRCNSERDETGALLSPDPKSSDFCSTSHKGSKRVWLVFEEAENQRTQEFALRWSPDYGRSFREIVRQQWNFTPPVTVRKTEDYTVDLSDVTVLELRSCR